MINQTVSQSRLEEGDRQTDTKREEEQSTCVEVFELDLCHHVLVCLQGDLEDISLLCLHEEEEHGLGLVGRAAHKDHAALWIVEIVTTTRDRAPDIRLVSQVLYTAIH